MNWNVLQYAMEHKIYLEKDWPYTMDSYKECTYDEAKASEVTLETYVCVEPKSPAGMKPAVAAQPIAIAIDAGEFVF